MSRGLYFESECVYTRVEILKIDYGEYNGEVLTVIVHVWEVELLN